MTLLDAIISVPMAIWTAILAVFGAPVTLFALGIFLLLTTVRLLFIVVADTSLKGKIWWILGAILSVWLGIAFIVWSVSSASPFTWEPR